MKIYAFGVREDERAAFEKYEKEYDLELSCTKEVLSLSNIDLVKGVTVLPFWACTLTEKRNWTS